MKTADDGLQCLAVLREFTPDVVVLEPELLWGGGDGVVSLLRDNPETRSVPVLALTTNSSRSAIYGISQFSVSDYLAQPVSTERLTGRVARLALGDQGPLTAESPRRASIYRIVRPTLSGVERRRDLNHVGVS